MDCIFQVHHSSAHLNLHKRAPPILPPPGSPPPSLEPSGTGSAGPSQTSIEGGGGGSSTSEADQRTLIIAASVGGTLLLVVALAIFFICLKRRRASRRIHQLQGFLPTFLDKDRTERYFREKPLSRNSSLKRGPSSSSAKGQAKATATAKAATPASANNNESQLTLQENASHSTLVTPPSQAVVSNLHNRAKAVPLARQHSLEKQGSGVFQQVLLDPSPSPSPPEASQAQWPQQQQQQQQPSPTEAGSGILGAIRRTISIRTASKDSPKQKQPGPSTPTEAQPSVLIGERGMQQLPERRTSDDLLRFPDGEEYHIATTDRGVPTSSSIEYQMNRFSSTSTQGGNNGSGGRNSSNDMLLLDPNRFSTMSVMFDARQLEEHQQQQEAAHNMYYQSHMETPRSQQTPSSTTTTTPSPTTGGNVTLSHPHHHHRTGSMSRQSMESGSSANSSDDDNAAISQLPEHQRLQAFHDPPSLTSPGGGGGGGSAMHLPYSTTTLPTSMPVPFSPGSYVPTTQYSPQPRHQHLHQQQQQQQHTFSQQPFDDKHELDEDDAQPVEMLMPTHTPPPPSLFAQPAAGGWSSAGPYQQ
ncbi:hypothetical protein DFQ27_009165 [Actinomortierella ambigua]|uniref:Uncharacterized protein n=1 Tax=Actinomortierella ambigua TaxID=1343610 RepID=A0A9P6PQH3_9FUNG|nr:hypothetical protein DFQ27_009165 [Actinomortierella ambigua]